MLHRSKSKDRKSDQQPGPAFMNKEQMSDYLRELRANRPTRPSGARPPPSSFRSNRHSIAGSFRAESPVPRSETPIDNGSSMSSRKSSLQSAHRKTSSASFAPLTLDFDANAGRPLVRQPSSNGQELEGVSGGDMSYQERGTRWLEKQEARSLRIALEHMDVDEEQRLHSAAQEEASELVWKHQNPDTSPAAPYRYMAHTEPGSLSRRSTWTPDGIVIQKGRTSRNGSISNLRRTSEGSEKTNGTAKGSATSSRVVSDSSMKSNGSEGSRRKKTGRTKSVQFDQSILEKEEQKHAVATPLEETVSAPKEVQENGQDQPETVRPGIAKVASTFGSVHFRNPFSRVRNARASVSSITRPASCPPQENPRPYVERVEIQRNPPSQSRNAAYTSNPATPPEEAVNIEKKDGEEETKMKDGKEIRSDDIRKATSMSLKDRSPKLPTPTMVSDSPGRPIVSFKDDWQPKEVNLKEEHSPVSAIVNPQTSSDSNKGGNTVPSRPNPPPTEIKSALGRLQGARVLPGGSSVKGFRSSPLARSSTLPITNSENPVTTTMAGITTPSSYQPASHIANTPSSSPTRKLPTVPSVSVHTTKAVSQPIPAVVLNGHKPEPPHRSQTAPQPPIPTICVPDEKPRPLPRMTSQPPIPTIYVPDDTPVPSLSAGPGLPVINVSPPLINVSAPSVNVTAPTISVSAPTINVSAPSISISDDSHHKQGPSVRPLPTPGNHSARPLPPTGHSKSSLQKNRPVWAAPYGSNPRNAVLCHTCALPISGRIVTAAGERFHPQCFLCFHCNEALECVAFFPEPDQQRAERLERIEARMRGEQGVPGDEYDDGDASLRFYCHLDYHEFFSPRCKTCKTPIEGDVIVACGSMFHKDHFFCAQCGDPFEETTPYVEKDGYAWCVNCHTNRFSPKCKKCRKPITDTVVKALGQEWHSACFCCTECKGEFKDGRYFIRQGSDLPVCPACEERRLKA